jgi:hypothetical protein
MNKYFCVTCSKQPVTQYILLKNSDNQVVLTLCKEHEKSLDYIRDRYENPQILTEEEYETWDLLYN